jgi:hypothetical protein
MKVKPPSQKKSKPKSAPAPHPDPTPFVALGTLLTLLAVARRLGVSPSAVRRWVAGGLKTGDGRTVYLKHVRLGGRIRIKAEWVDEFIQDLTRSHFPSGNLLNAEQEANARAANAALAAEGW